MSRLLTITRKKQFVGGGSPFYIYLDGRNHGKIYSGESVDIPISNANHSLKIQACFGGGENYWSNEYSICANDKSVTVSVYSKSKLTTVDIYIM